MTCTVAILETEWIKGAASASEMPYTLPNLKLFNAKRKFRAGIEVGKFCQLHHTSEHHRIATVTGYSCRKPNERGSFWAAGWVSSCGSYKDRFVNSQPSFAKNLSSSVLAESIDSIRELATQFQVKADNGTQLNKVQMRLCTSASWLIMLYAAKFCWRTM